jgi:DNA-binding LytR/AlgR family response regulator
MENIDSKNIHIKDGKKEYYIAPIDILLVKADGNYSDIYLTQSTLYKAVRIQIGQLSDLIEQADTPHFLARVDRSTIINLKYVKYVDAKKGVVTLRWKDEDVNVTIAKSSGSSLSEQLAPLMRLNDEASTIKREDYPTEQAYNLAKSADELKRTVHRMSTILQLFKE